MKKIYYALYDKQTSTLLASGRNARSLYELMEDYLSYKSADSDTHELRERIIEYGIARVLAEDDFEIVEQKKRFPDWRDEV